MRKSLKLALPRSRCAAIMVLVACLAFCGCGKLWPSEEQTEQAAALKKSLDWYGQKAYPLAEARAREAGDSVEAQDALFQSLAAQADSEVKQDQAETVAEGLAQKADGQPALSAKEFLAKRQALRKERQEQRKTPRAALDIALAGKGKEADALRKSKVLSVSEEVEADTGWVKVALEFSNPYTGKGEKAELELACAKLRDGWAVDWQDSDLDPVSVLFGEPQHAFSERGVKDIASFDDSFGQWKTTLDLVSADDAAISKEQYLKEKWRDPHPSRPVREPIIFRSRKSGLLACRQHENFPPWYLKDHLIVTDRKYRLASGLGVGSRVDDFLVSYALVDPKGITSQRATAFVSEGVEMEDGFVWTMTGVEVKSPSEQKNLILYLSASEQPHRLNGQRLGQLPVLGMAYALPMAEPDPAPAPRPSATPSGR